MLVVDDNTSNPAFSRILSTTKAFTVSTPAAPRNVARLLAEHRPDLDTRSPVRGEFLGLAARFAEFCGWLSQDQRRYPDAERWTSKALDFAQALDDPHLISYTLMRRSNIATETGRGHDALLLAQAALRPRPLTPGLRAVAYRQKAAALALLSDERGTGNRLTRVWTPPAITTPFPSSRTARCPT